MRGAGIRKGLGRRLRELFSRGLEGEGFFEELEEILIEGDLGARFAGEVVVSLRGDARSQRLQGRGEILSFLQERLENTVRVNTLPVQPGRLAVLLVLGVNGVGKTTTIAKLAHYYHTREGLGEVVLAAADTFRAAAIEQLQSWGRRLGVRVVSQESGSDPGAVVFDAISSAQARGAELLIIDTAGRLHNKRNLVKELEKLDKIVRNRAQNAAYAKVLVVDATTGQNALQQAETFHEAVSVDSGILAKYDSTARGGVVIPICERLGLGFSFMGVGEKMEDLLPFDRTRYAAELLRADLR